MSELQTKVKLVTTLGDIVIKLDGEKAPISSENFLTYVREGFYDGTIFHRVIPGFMAQGGGFTEDFEQKGVHAPIENEAANGLKNSR
ncbi:MAG: peptidylprolyl isomerase, partial [Gammaproteobacteria bacterium]